MPDEPENLTLVFLRRIDAAVQDVRQTLAEHGQRLNRIEVQIAGLRRDQGTDAEAVALLGARLDRFGERLGRIERRLDITDDPVS